ALLDGHTHLGIFQIRAVAVGQRQHDITVGDIGRQDEVVVLEIFNILGAEPRTVHFQHVAAAGAAGVVCPAANQTATQCRRALEDHPVVRGIATGREAAENRSVDLSITLDRDRIAHGITVISGPTVDGVYGTAAYRDDIVTGIASTRAFHVATIDGGSKRSTRHHHGV